eukprot:Polyplicarium_translucidae@DN2886_c0_g1_i1.p1
MNVLVSASDDPHRPLSLPVWFEPAVGTNEGVDEEYLRSDWIDAVKERVEFGDPGEEREDIVQIYIPPEMVPEVVVVNMTVTQPVAILVLGSTPVIRLQFHRESNFLEVHLTRFGGADAAVQVPKMDGPELWDRTIVVQVPMIDEPELWDLSIVIDRNVVELNFGGWMFRTVSLSRNGAAQSVSVAAAKVHAGWVLGTATPTQPRPLPRPPRRLPPAPQVQDRAQAQEGHERRPAWPWLFLFLLCFFR